MGAQEEKRQIRRVSPTQPPRLSQGRQLKDLGEVGRWVRRTCYVGSSTKGIDAAGFGCMEGSVEGSVEKKKEAQMSGAFYSRGCRGGGGAAARLLSDGGEGVPLAAVTFRLHNGIVLRSNSPRLNSWDGSFLWMAVLRRNYADETSVFPTPVEGIAKGLAQYQFKSS